MFHVVGVEYFGIVVIVSKLHDSKIDNAGRLFQAVNKDRRKFIILIYKPLIALA